MLKRIMVFILNCLTCTSMAGEILFNSDYSYEANQRAKDLVLYIKKVPKFSTEIDPVRDISSTKFCSSQALPFSKKSLNDLGTSLDAIDGCLGYKIMEELINKSSESNLTKKDYQKNLGFNVYDSMIKFVKNNDYEKAYNYLQIYYDKDVLYKTDDNGDSIFHILAGRCTDPKAQDLLMLLTRPPDEYRSKYFNPLKIHTTETEQKKISSQCQKFTAEQVMKKFFANDFITMTNKKGKNVFDIMKPECKGTPIQEILANQFDQHIPEIISKTNFSLDRLELLFPDTYKDKLILFLDSLPRNKSESIVSRLDFTNFNFIDGFGNYVFSSIPYESILGKKLREKFVDEVIRTADVGGDNLEKYIKYSEKNPDILIKKNSQGKSVLELIRNSNPRLFNEASLSLSLRVVNDLEQGKVSPFLWEYLKNGNLSPVDSESYKFFNLISKLPNEETREKIFSQFKINYDDTSFGVEEISNLFSKTNENISDSDFSKVSNETCEILVSYQKNISCDKFTKDQIERRKSLEVSGSLEITLLNLIDQATRTGQNTTAYLLLNQLAKLNSELARSYLKKLNLADAQLDDQSYSAFKPILLSKISGGQLDCSTYRYRFNEFITKYFSPTLGKDFQTEDQNSNNPCLVSAKKNEEALHFIGVTKDNHPLLSMESFEQAADREIKPYKESVIRVRELTKNGEYTAALGEAYTLSQTSSAKVIVNSATLKSYITDQNTSTCIGFCETLFLINTSINVTAMGKEMLNYAELGGVLGLAGRVFFPSIKVISVASGAAIGLFKGIYNFGIDEYTDAMELANCKDECVVSNHFKNQDELLNVIKERKTIFKKMQDQDQLVWQMLDQYKQNLSLLARYPNDNDIKIIQAQFISNFNGLLNNASSINNNFEKIAKLKVSNVDEMKNLGLDLINSRTILLNKMQTSVEQFRIQINAANNYIANKQHEPQGDPPGPKPIPHPGPAPRPDPLPTPGPTPRPEPQTKPDPPPKPDPPIIIHGPDT